MKTSTKVAIGIFAGLAVYLIYKMFSGYSQNSSMNVQSSNIQQPTSDTGSLETPVVTVMPTVPPSIGPSVTVRKGRDHF